MKKIVISTGAGMSAESGLSTFRDADGLWDNYDVMEVASADGFARNPALVHEFYNIRRKELLEKEPNVAHRRLVDLEKYFDVQIITQNVDDLHERAGSKKVLHLHGELMKVRSIEHPDRVYSLTPDNLTTTPESRDPQGDHLRPHIVFFQDLGVLVKIGKVHHIVGEYGELFFPIIGACPGPVDRGEGHYFVVGGD